MLNATQGRPTGTGSVLALGILWCGVALACSSGGSRPGTGAGSGGVSNRGGSGGSATGGIAGVAGHAGAGGSSTGGAGSGGIGSGGIGSGGIGSGGIGSGGACTGPQPGLCSAPDQGTCFHDPLPYDCDSSTGQWRCPFGTSPAPPRDCSGSGGSSGTGGQAGGGATGTGGGTAAGGDGGGSQQALGLNDVTILAPLPQTGAGPVLLAGADLAEDGTPLVPRDVYDRVSSDAVTGKPLPTLDTSYARLQLVAVRFDLCDRHLPGPCAESDDASLRLVFQPISAQGSAADIGFHVFYAIHNDEIGGAIGTLRALAALAAPADGVLRVSATLAGPNGEPYAAGLRALVRHYAGRARLVRLTMNAQNLNASALVWFLRGVEKHGDAFVDSPLVDIPIAGSTAISETVTMTGSPGFQVTPNADTPAGLAVALSQTMFSGAETSAKRDSLAALAAVDNPLTSTADTVPCVACHVATVIMNSRASITAMDPLALPGRYTSGFDLSVAGGNSAMTPTTLRALGYLGVMPMISQRVVNETAQVLEEIQHRFAGP